MTIAQLKSLVLKLEGGDKSMGRKTSDSASKYPCPTPYAGKTGWHTVEGITYKTWIGVFGKNQDARWYAMSDEDWFTIFKTRFFDKVQGTRFKSMNVAAVVVDISFMSGPEAAIINLQRAILDCGGKLPKYGVDGDPGNETLTAANAIDPLKLIKAIVPRRKAFLHGLADGNTPKEIKNRENIKGWINRTNRYLGPEFLIGI